MTVTYHGVRPDGPGGAVIEVRDGGETLGVVRHIPHHSPDGMSWGYAGSGPADCARSLLVAALGDVAAQCTTCEGEGRVCWLPPDFAVAYPASHATPGERVGATSCECGDGYRALPYQEFKFEFVANWGDTWSMSRADILAWLAARGVQ